MHLQSVHISRLQQMFPLLRLFSHRLLRIRRLDLKTGRSAPAATGPIEGAADFILYDSMIVVPGMAEKKIHIMPIGGKK